jgi:uncharacterized protein YndB with AHSA1/START domain
MANVLANEVRRVENREHLGKPAFVAIAGRTYDTTVEDLWDALTTAERLARWFPVEGDLELGGRYRIEGNASGTIERCEPPRALDVTWEMGPTTSWVSVRLAPDGERARLTLEHIAHREAVGEEFLAQFGPGAVGIGWDLALRALELHMADPDSALDRAEAEAWVLSPEGNAFVRTSGEAWGAAHAESGEDPAEARAKAERTIGFYTGR